MTIGFVGDICLGNDFNEKYSPVNAMDDSLLEEMVNVDIMVANSEVVFSDRGEETKWKLFHMRSRPENISYLQQMGIDLLTLANNHVYDYGLEGLEDTLKTIDEAGIKRTGAGKNYQEASKPAVFNVNGLKIAFISGCSSEFPLQKPTARATENHEGIMSGYFFGNKLVREIKKAKENNDYVFVFMHWGIENTTLLTPWQRINARKFINAGADAVIGCHPHIVQGIEYYRGAPIFYSLGNFIFDQSDSKTRLMVKLTIEEGKLSSFVIPCKGFLHIIENDTDKNEFFMDLSKYSPGRGIKIDSNGAVLTNVFN